MAVRMGVECQSYWPSVGLSCVGEPSVALEVLLVEDELNVSLGVGQTLFLQRLSQLGGATQEHPNLGPESGGRVNQKTLPVADFFWFFLWHQFIFHARWNHPQIYYVLEFYLYS